MNDRKRGFKTMLDEGGRIVIEPVRNTKEYDLEQLLAGITPENLHSEVDFGPAVGKEAF
jgi:antitoxin MazE